MFLKSTEVQSMAQALARHSAGRQALVARNLANADTPGYRPRDLADFGEIFRNAGRDNGLRATRQGHIGGQGHKDVAVVTAKGAPNPNGNAVSVEREMVKGVELRQSHDLALAVQKTLGSVLRSTLGRR
jgi:flagellar basal-body rod protein FlgB